MSGTVRLRHVTLGAGPTKIAAPLVATTADALLREADDLVAAGVDIAEWRLDHLLAARGVVAPPPDLTELLAGLRAKLGDVPLLATVRSSREGGEIALTGAQYAALLSALADAGDARATAIDVELAREADSPGLVAAVQQRGVVVVASAHDFAATPARAQMVDTLARMAATGADVVKLAVMPHDPTDVLELLAATYEANLRLDQPVVTMAMGRHGVVSRLAGAAFGSVLTFGAVAVSSAPGQVDVARLRDVVTLIDETGHTPTDASPRRPDTAG